MSDVQLNMNEKSYVDLDTGLSRVRGNQMLYNRMLGMFLNSQEFDKMEEFLQEKDYEKAGEVAHAIKGMTGNLALTKVFETSTRLMNEFRQGIADEGAIAEYREALVRTREIVEKIVG